MGHSINALVDFCAECNGNERDPAIYEDARFCIIERKMFLTLFRFSFYKLSQCEIHQHFMKNSHWTFRLLMRVVYMDFICTFMCKSDISARQKRKCLWYKSVHVNYARCCPYSACVITWLCTDSTPQDCYRVLNDHTKTSHWFKHGYNNGRWVVLYALVSPQWPHAWFCGRVRTTLFPATKLHPCVNKLGGLM